jgi:L-threonylcarbamoyladenylate synthase
MKSFDADIMQSLPLLQSGCIILYPTDTIWGIGCDATNVNAIKKIYSLKQRAEKKSMIILLSRIDEIKNYVLHPSKKIIDYINDQEYPTTAIFENAINLPTQLINEDGSIAIRITRDEFCKMLIQHLAKPLVSTSANISGEPSPTNFSEISDTIKNGIDYIVQYRRDELKNAQPSSIIRLNDRGEIIKIR